MYKYLARRAALGDCWLCAAATENIVKIVVVNLLWERWSDGVILYRPQGEWVSLQILRITITGVELVREADEESERSRRTNHPWHTKLGWIHECHGKISAQTIYNNSTGPARMTSAAEMDRRGRWKKKTAPSVRLFLRLKTYPKNANIEEKRWNGWNRLPKETQNEV